MITELRQTGLDLVGDVPWGTHLCSFYDTKEDLLETLVPYFRAGLENRESCLWVIPEFMTPEEARNALQEAVADFSQYLARGSIEIVPGVEWYFQGGRFDGQRVLAQWNAKLDQALARGYEGIRATGDKSRIDRQSWRSFCEYEMDLNWAVLPRPIIMLCTYPISQCGVADLLDVARTHQSAMARRQGNWEVVETPELKAAKAEIKKLNEGLETRIVARTRELAAANEELATERDALRTSEQRYQNLTETLERRIQQAVDELRQKDDLLILQGRQALMGETISTIAHHWRQPLNTLGVLTQNLRMLIRTGIPDRDAIDGYVQRSIEIIRSLSKSIDGFRTFFQAEDDKVAFSVSEVIANALALLGESFQSSDIKIEIQAATGLVIEGYPNEFSQVILNILMNAKDAFSARNIENPVINIRAFSQEDRTRVVISDNAGGIPVEIMGRIFDPYFSTKGPGQGTGVGLFISRSIVEKRMNGALTVRNVADGAEFTIEI